MSERDERLIERGDRVILVAATFSLLEAAMRGGDDLARALSAAPPLSWPPEHNDPSMFAWVADLMRRNPGEPGYHTWFVIGDGRLCGTAGFKGPPDADGVVEIGYSVVTEDQRMGFASGAVSLLIARAFTDPRVQSVTAETLPDAVASQAVLHRCGFVAIGTRHDEADGDLSLFAHPRPH